MAKAKTTKTDTVETKLTLKTAARKGALAYLGLYGVAFERAKLRTEQVKGLYAKTTDVLFEDLVKRGEVIETEAVKIVKTAGTQATGTIETARERVLDILPIGANDRVAELEAEVATLNKKIKAISKKATVGKAATAKAA